VTLPHLIKCNLTKWGYFLFGGACTLILYQLTNRVHLWEPQLLEFDAVDNLMPFLPWTVWIYIVEYAYFIIAYFGLRNNENITRYFYAYMFILLFSIVIFIFYPVTFPRQDFPVDKNIPSEWALWFLRTYMDNPANCLPSLHVSSCFISSFCFWKESKWKTAVLVFGSVLVSISTMTTKQHYFVDVWTAFLLTVVAYWFFFYVVKLGGSGNEAGANR
jgi:membrane-associated phospholipid phosphatase